MFLIVLTYVCSFRETINIFHTICSGFCLKFCCLFSDPGCVTPLRFVRAVELRFVASTAFFYTGPETTGIILQDNA